MATVAQNSRPQSSAMSNSMNSTGNIMTKEVQANFLLPLRVSRSLIERFQEAEARIAESKERSVMFACWKIGNIDNLV